MKTAAIIRSRVECAPVGTFLRTSDFAEYRPSAVATAFSRMARARPDLVRIRKGLYWKGVDSRFGAGSPDVLETALAASGRGAGPSGVSAANALGLTTQMAAVPTVAVLGRCPTGLHGVRVVSRSNFERYHLLPLEIALLEVLREFPLHVEGSWADLVRRVREENERGGIRLDAVLRAAATEHSPALRARAASLDGPLPPTPMVP